MRRNLPVKDEAALCLVGERYLADLRWDLYKEVTVPTGIVDIVGVQAPLRWAVEAKMTAGMAVLEQAIQRRNYFHYVSILIPVGAGWLFEHVCKTNGIGILRAQADGSGTVRVSEYLRPVLRRKVLSVKLYEQQKTTVAGLPSPLRVTPFTMTCESIRNELKRCPEGLGLGDLVERISHHYGTPSTARISLAQWMRAGVVKGVEYKDGKAYLAADATHGGPGCHNAREGR